MDDVRKIKKVLGVLIHLSEHRGINVVSDDLKESKFFQKESEELKTILTKNWNHIDELTKKFNEFQQSLNIDRKDF